jgi:hypothetical protein
MLSVYPFASGSLYTAGYVVTASQADGVQLIRYVTSASTAATVLYPETGPRGKGVCLLTAAQYELMVATGRLESCSFSS